MNVPELSHPDKLDYLGTELDKRMRYTCAGERFSRCSKKINQLESQQEKQQVRMSFSLTGYCEYKIIKMFCLSNRKMSDYWNIHIYSHMVSYKLLSLKYSKSQSLDLNIQFTFNAFIS